jgi:ubiquinone/menaquinone biosynthesis C-methylase UbiE
MVASDKITPNFLEVGCGGGKQTLELAKEILSTCFGINPSEVAINSAISYVETNHPEMQSRLEFKVGNAGSLDFPDKYFEHVYFGFVYIWLTTA